jgi:hypothetical protein
MSSSSLLLLEEDSGASRQSALPPRRGMAGDGGTPVLGRVVAARTKMQHEY